MRRVLSPALVGGLSAFVAFLLPTARAEVLSEDSAASKAAITITNLSQLRQYAEQQNALLRPLRIVADVYDADVANGVLLLHDATGFEFVKLDFHKQRIERGATIRLEAKGCGVKPMNFGLSIIPGLIVDNDGVHGMSVASGAVFLSPGAKPIKLQWFNRIGDFGLTAEFEGPGLPRQQIPSSVLTRISGGGAALTNPSAPGVNYRCYEGLWGYLPDFDKYPLIKTGVATNFDVNVRTRNEGVGLEFDGFLQIPQEGVYTFYTTSDDGSRLFIGKSSLLIRVVKEGFEPRAIENIPASVILRDSRPWVTLTGDVNFVGVRGMGGELQLQVGNDEIRVELFENGNFLPNLHCGDRVQVSGVYQDIITTNGSQAPGMLMAISWKAVRPTPQTSKSAPRMLNELTATNHMASELSQSASTTLLTKAEQVKTLPAALAKLGLPVSIRGVVIATLPTFDQGAVVQDSTKGVYVYPQGAEKTRSLRLGDYCQIDGVTDPGLFAPVIAAHRVEYLGAGHFPEPVHATWDQLVNGSLDTQYAEIEGVIISVQDQRLVLLTQGGTFTVDLDDFQGTSLGGYENAVVRIRGCFLPYFNLQTHDLAARSLRIKGGAIEVLQSAPRELFNAPQRGISELLHYDPKASAFRRLKVTGQVIYSRAGECYLIDGTNGIHITTKGRSLYAVGDLAEAVGFLQLGGAAAELNEAVTRRIGHAPLPAPIKLPPDRLLQASFAGMLVQAEATLMNRWQDASESVLEVQSGFVAFRARLDTIDPDISSLPAGSRLQITGVYVPRSNQAEDGSVNAFDILLPSTDGIRVLARPPWWTLKRVLTLAGVLATLLCLALLWNKELQWKLQERGRQLETEIRNREQAELQRVAEGERSRIARDLHDELGTGLTELSLVAGAGMSECPDASRTAERLKTIAEKARDLVSGLDVIVWAIDPKRNSLQSFADYLARYVTELFAASSIVCRFKIPIEFDGGNLTEKARHSLFLAVKEALHNVIRHALATEVELQISRLGDCLHVIIADNGRGFDMDAVQRGNGLANLQARLEELNGHCFIDPKVGLGTTVKFMIPLPPDPRQVPSAPNISIPI